MVDRRPRGLPPRVEPPLASAVTNRGARLMFTQTELTPWQKLRRRWNAIVPHTTDIGSLFLAAERRHHVRLNWRNPLAIPFVVLVDLLSPLLLTVAVLGWILDKVLEWRRLDKDKRSNGR